MNFARLGAAGAAAGVVALCAAGPAFATETPTPPAGWRRQQGHAFCADDQAARPGAQRGREPEVLRRRDTLTFTVQHCSMQPTITDVNHLFVATHPFVETGKGDFAAKETVRKDLIDGHQYKVVVHCGRWTDTFTTKPHKKPTPTPTPTASEPTGVPSGAPQTGDGSSNGGGNAGLIAGGAGVVLAGLAGGTFLYTRRRSSAGA